MAKTITDGYWQIYEYLTDHWHLWSDLLTSDKRLKVYMTGSFLFARWNLPKVLISISKFFFDNDFPSSCFDIPKASNFTSGGVQNRKTRSRKLGMNVTSFQDFKLSDKQISPTFCYFLINNALLYHFLWNTLAHNEKMTETSVFLWSAKSWNDVTFIPSVLFLVLRFFTLQEVKFDAFGTSKHGEGKSLSKKNLLCLLFF